MVTIDLADTLTFEPGSGIAVDDEVCGGLGVDGVPVGPENLVVRALASLSACTATPISDHPCPPLLLPVQTRAKSNPDLDRHARRPRPVPES